MKKLYRNDILKQLRRAKSLSLREAEPLLKVSRTTIARAEAGNTGLAVEILAKIAAGYKIPLISLFDPTYKLDIGALVTDDLKQHVANL